MNVVAAIDFHRASIYAVDAPGRPPKHVAAADPRGHFHQVHHLAGNPHGIYEADSPEYWRAITDALPPIGAIMILGHGEGKANASHRWLDYVQKRRKDVAARVVAELRVDLERLHEEQVVQLARQCFEGLPARAFADGRWGVERSA